MNHLDEITVTGIRATGFHGVYDFERRDGQEFVAALTLYLQLDKAAASDDGDATASDAVVSEDTPQVADAVSDGVPSISDEDAGGSE